MSRVKVVVSPLYYERVIRIVKKARAQSKVALRQWIEAEEKNGPLFTEITRLRARALVASLENSLRLTAFERDRLKTRLEMIGAAVDSLKSTES